MSVSLKKVETVYHETGIGQADRTESEYQLGAEIDGVFVPFATMSENRAQVFVEAGKAAAEADKAKAKATT